MCYHTVSVLHTVLSFTVLSINDSTIPRPRGLKSGVVEGGQTDRDRDRDTGWSAWSSTRARQEIMMALVGFGTKPKGEILFLGHPVDPDLSPLTGPERLTPKCIFGK